MCVCACVWTPFTHLEAAYASELLCWLQSQPNQSSPSLCLSPFLTHNQNYPVFQSFLSIQLCNSIYHFILFYFTPLSYHSSLFSKLFQNITFRSLVQPFLLLSETCLYKVNLSLTKGCPSASLDVLEKCFEKCVERIKVRPGTRTSSFYSISPYSTLEPPNTEKLMHID